MAKGKVSRKATLKEVNREERLDDLVAAREYLEMATARLAKHNCTMAVKLAEDLAILVRELEEKAQA